MGQVLGFVLGSRGSMVIFRYVEDKFEAFCRIDVRIWKQNMKIVNHEQEDPE